VTDGEYTYLHPCRSDERAECYSSMMMNPYGWFSSPEPREDAEAGQFLPYTETPVWRYSAESNQRHADPMLFDVTEDYWQEDDLAGESTEQERMRDLLVTALDELEAPQQQYARLGLEG